MSTITQEQQDAIAEYLAVHDLPSGLGTEQSACSIASINLVLTGRLTANIPECMSYVVGSWIIPTQDAMPNGMRNSAEWKNLLPLAAGTGRKHEAERAKLVLQWMWEEVLPHLSNIAEKYGFGEAWSTMLKEKTAESAYEIRKSYATNAAYAAAAAAAAAAYAADAAADAADAAYAAYAAADAAYAAADAAAAHAHAHAAHAAHAARGYAEAAAAAAAAKNEFWKKANPCGLLARLIAVSN